VFFSCAGRTAREAVQFYENVLDAQMLKDGGEVIAPLDRVPFSPAFEKGNGTEKRYLGENRCYLKANGTQRSYCH
jgi:hypothetical protein